MRIAFLVDTFPVISETFIVNQIVGLINRGHDIHIYTKNRGNMSKYHTDITKYNLLEKTTLLEQAPRSYLWRLIKGFGLFITNFHKAPLAFLYSFNFLKYGKKALSLRLMYSIVQMLESEPYDIIHCQFGMHGLEGMLYRDIGALKGKLITSFRGYDISYYLQEEGNDVYDELLLKGDFFLANCEFFRQRAIKLGCDPKKIVVHGSGIDCSRFIFQTRNITPGETIQIATTGRLVEKKGIEYAIRAIAKVAEFQPNVEFKIIGDGPLKEHFEQVIQELNIGDKVQLLGWMNQKEIIEVLNKTHIFVAPSVTASDGNQDAPVNTLKEAMAMGLPVVSTFHGGIPELVKDGVSGFLVPEKDETAIAEKLIYLIEHPEIWSSMGSSGREYVEAHYDINNLNDELERIYHQVSIDKLPTVSETVRTYSLTPQ
ncbi:glycosyltransferase [Mastigocoleus testarum]|uniref:Glycosyltransferase n=1 Tax=Mastigocoleus testarum BC008 TaxID=371196 RepID=A0A0V8A030_9CYAN|nr:glycosyltransferase [Mastigocoleus testarum]KST69930.1 glycosyltransferase [Mastigocoleus testarum BC008]KST69953.1 glycosyltransferase [Mastigocoleus testarum BC008]